jgi:hypothetical protein
METQHEITLELGCVPQLADRLPMLDRLYAAGCSEAKVVEPGGRIFATFKLAAESLSEAAAGAPGRN